MIRSLWLLAILSMAACAPESDPTGEHETPKRIVTLSPGLTELTFAAGAGDLLVGVSAYSDYPPAAADIPVIGDAFAIDQEQLAVLQPDLLLVWPTGTPDHVIDELEKAGYRVEPILTRSLSDIATAIQQIGALTDRGETANAAASAYEQAMAERTALYSDRSPVRVFYQIDRRPLYTINGQHFISELIEVCGGRNIFDDLNALAPTVAVEAVLDRDPEAILAGIAAGDSAFDEWRRWPNLAAIRHNNLFLMPGDTLTRATPRLVSAVDDLCEALQTVRDRRENAAPTN